jgi:septal ring-binding cell division protein DamX
LVEAFKESGAGMPVEQKIAEKPSEAQEPGHQHAQVEKILEQETKIESEDVAAAVAGEENEPAGDSTKVGNPDNGKNKPPKKPEKEYRFNRRRNYSGAWIVAAIFIIVLLAVGWLFFTNKLQAGKNMKTKSAVDPADSVESLHSSGKKADEFKQFQLPTLLQTQFLPHKNADNSDSSSMKYGLKGAVNHHIDKAYTIIIHSFGLKTTVKKIADSLSQKGYRAVMEQTKFNGKTGWRVGVGQFKTIKTAKQAVKHLPERYQKSHFIHRINQ